MPSGGAGPPNLTIGHGWPKGARAQVGDACPPMLGHAFESEYGTPYTAHRFRKNSS